MNARVCIPWSLSAAVLLALVTAPAASADPACISPKPGRYAMKIQSAPPGATVYINSKTCPPVGVTPWEGKLAAGKYTLILEAPGYDEATRPMKVAKVRKGQEVFVPLIKKVPAPSVAPTP